MIGKRFNKKLGRDLWGFDIRLNGRRIREFIYGSKADAEKALLALRIAARERRYGLVPAQARPTLDQLIKKRLATITRHAEQIRSARVLETWLELLPDGIFVDELDSTHVQLYIDRRAADGLIASSIDRELNIIAATLNSARMHFPVLKQWIPPKVPRPKVPKRGRERLISEEEVAALLGRLLAPKDPEEKLSAYQARRRVGLMVRWALLTGMRHGEIVKLRWADIDWKGNQIKVVGTKTDTIRYLVITPTMREILEERKQLGEPFVFSRGGNIGPKFYRILRQTCADLGILYGRRVLGGLVLHDARHTATTRMLQAGIDLATIGSITGHRDQTLILYYSHATQMSRARAAEVLEEWAGKKAG